MKVTNNQRFESVFDQHFDPVKRIVWLWKGVEENAVARAAKALITLDSHEEKPITVFISTLGGSEYEMFAFYDLMQSCRSKIYTIGVGKVMSAGVLILAAGYPGHRYITPNSYVMNHTGSASAEGTTKNIMKTGRHYEHMERRWCELMTEHTRKKLEHWQELCKDGNDFYITAKQTLELGIADKYYSKDTPYMF